MYNEEPGAENCVRAVCAELARMPQRAGMIVVNDASKDGTGRVLEDLSPQYENLIVVTHPQNSGYGSALRTGALRARREGFDYALFMDSDLTNQPRDIPRFAALMEQNYDVIKATRYSLGGSVSGVPGYRVWISRIGNSVARLLYRLPVHDCTNGFRAARLDLLAQMDLTENRFPVIMEELYWSKFLAKTFAEVPVELTDRANHLRRSSFTYRPSTFWRYLKYPLKAFLGIRPGRLATSAQGGGSKAPGEI
jgi:glycosyltransferase involved in cell wall biosynthesis